MSMKDQDNFKLYTTDEKVDAVFDFIKNNNGKAKLTEVVNYFKVHPHTARRYLYFLQGQERIKPKLDGRMYYYVAQV